MVFSIIARKGRTKKIIAATLAIIVATMSLAIMSISTTASAKETAVQTTNAATPQVNKLITEFTLEQRGSEVYHARKILKTSTLGTELLPTGVAALAGEEIKVYVTNVESTKLLPKITFTQQVGYWGNWKRTFQLKPGVNTFKVPKIYDNKWKTKVIPGGAIYMENPYTATRQGKAPHIRIEGGHKYPLFRDGDNVEQFMQELKDYKTKLKNNKDKYVDIVELVNDYVILNSNMASAEVAFMKKGSNQTPQGTLNFHKERMAQLLAYAGIGETGDIKHIRNGVRANMRLMQPWALAYAYGDHTGFQQAAANSLFEGKTYGWAIAHELGHHYDVQGGYIAEITNNMWANYNNVDLQNDSDRMAKAYATIFKKHASDDHATLTKSNTVNGLAMWWQLHLLNENYWANYQAAYRNGIAGNMGLTEYERMATVSSYALGMDVTEHFVRYKFITEKSAQKVSNALKALNVPAAAENIKPWYMWTKATKDRSSVFEQVYTPEIVSVKENAGKVVMQLKIDNSVQKALLGYEIVRDDKVLGFTNTNTFTSNVAVDGLGHTYRVRAFDLRSNATTYSVPVTVTDSTYAMNLATVTDSTYSIDSVSVTDSTYSIVIEYENLTDALPFTGITPTSDDNVKQEDDIPVVDEEIEKNEEDKTSKVFSFTDVDAVEGNWKYDSVKYVYENNIMNGSSDTNKFEPDSSLTRSMFATVLYRMAGNPDIAYTDTFSDVAEGKWYSEAILWANQEGIASGLADGRYGIDVNITREQIAKMLYEYAKRSGYDVSGQATLDDFTDKNSVSGWATGHMKWATAAGMISGKPNGDGTYRLDPKGEATRAECAAMLTRFIKKYQEAQ